MINVLLYKLAIGAYALGIRVAALFKPKARLFIDGRIGLLDKIKSQLSKEQKTRIWVHCASLGEFEQGRPVIEALKEKYPQYAIVLTFFSPSGYEVRKDYNGADHIFYLPVDNHHNAEAFLDIVKPQLCLFIKYELWYFYLSGIAKRNIPSLLVSAIFNNNQGFFKWYGGLQRKMLDSFTHLFVQDQNSIDLLSGIGITTATVSGDTRFDRVVKAAQQTVELPIAKEFCAQHKVLIAGSSWGDDERLLYNTLSILPADWRIILVPHEVHSAHIAEIEKLYGKEVIKWSTWEQGNDKKVLLVDKVGFLLQLYRYGTVAFIGGGYGKAGVHNVLEAAVYGLPCFYGPVFHQFIEAIELVSEGGAQVINKPEELAAALKSFESDAVYNKVSSTAKHYVLSKQGATDKVMARIGEYL